MILPAWAWVVIGVVVVGVLWCRTKKHSSNEQDPTAPGDGVPELKSTATRCDKKKVSVVLVLARGKGSSLRLNQEILGIRKVVASASIQVVECESSLVGATVGAACRGKCPDVHRSFSASSAHGGEAPAAETRGSPRYPRRESDGNRRIIVWLHLVGNHSSGTHEYDERNLLVARSYDQVVSTIAASKTDALELVFANSCNTASFAEALRGAGIPVTVGWQTACADQGASVFAIAFYAALAKTTTKTTNGVSRALNMARAAVLHPISAGVVYRRAFPHLLRGDGDGFELAQAPVFALLDPRDAETVDQATGRAFIFSPESPYVSTDSSPDVDALLEFVEGIFDDDDDDDENENANKPPVIVTDDEEKGARGERKRPLLGNPPEWHVLYSKRSRRETQAQNFMTHDQVASQYLMHTPDYRIHEHSHNPNNRPTYQVVSTNPERLFSGPIALGIPILLNDLSRLPHLSTTPPPLAFSPIFPRENSLRSASSARTSAVPDPLTPQVPANPPPRTPLLASTLQLLGAKKVAHLVSIGITHVESLANMHITPDIAIKATKNRRGDLAVKTLLRWRDAARQYLQRRTQFKPTTQPPIISL